MIVVPFPGVESISNSLFNKDTRPRMMARLNGLVSRLIMPENP